jgi:hypothetical protein
MTQAQKEQAMDEIYAVALKTARELGVEPTEQDAEWLVDAISDYLGPSIEQVGS